MFSVASVCSCVKGTQVKRAPPSSRWQRKLRKLLRNPAGFFADARLVRAGVTRGAESGARPPGPDVAESWSLAFREIQLSERVHSPEHLDPSRYLEANPDVRRAGVDPKLHFLQHGQQEGRSQYVLGPIQHLRAEKLAKIRFSRRPVDANRPSMPQNFLRKDVIDSFEIPEQPPIAQNDYNPEIVDLIRANPEKLFLDVGAGLRHTYYSNVVNAEVWPSVTTDVVCVGEDLPFASEQFDFVLCLAVLEHTKHPWSAVQEILRVLKPDGCVRIDWPFLQPVHGYPHHYFNATPKGLISQFEDACEILSAEVRPWQHPMYTITWIMQEWRAGLPEAERERFDAMKVSDFLTANMQELLALPISTDLSRPTQGVIGAGTTLIARKRKTGRVSSA
jgi:SAM-dependent methyltransferase